VGSQNKRYQLRVMVDASAFIDDLRLFSARLGDSIALLGLYATNKEIFVHAGLDRLIREIESGYATILRPEEQPTASEARLGSSEPQCKFGHPGEFG